MEGLKYFLHLPMNFFPPPPVNVSARRDFFVLSAANGALCILFSGDLDSPSTSLLRAFLRASDGPAMKLRTATANGALCDPGAPTSSRLSLI